MSYKEFKHLSYPAIESLYKQAVINFTNNGTKENQRVVRVLAKAISKRVYSR